MVRSLRETGTAALAHAEALAALLKLELKEASKRLGKKTDLLLMGAFMAFFGYLFLWCLLTVVMEMCIRDRDSSNRKPFPATFPETSEPSWNCTAPVSYTHLASTCLFT